LILGGLSFRRGGLRLRGCLGGCGGLIGQVLLLLGEAGQSGHLTRLR
jgi:hypothetical protein